MEQNILLSFDDNEEAKGVFIDINMKVIPTAISFEQLPAGVSGAYKLLVNLISLSNE